MRRIYFGMHRFEWPDGDSVEFHLGHGDMIRLLRCCGFEVEDLVELRPEPGATTRYPFVTLATVPEMAMRRRPEGRKSSWAGPSAQVFEAADRAGRRHGRRPHASTVCAAEAPLPTCELRPCQRP